MILPFFYGWVIVVGVLLAGVGSGLGALFAGIALDQFGNYVVIFTAFLASYLVSAILIFLARKPVIRISDVVSDSAAV